MDWIKVSDELPKPLTSVFIYNGRNTVIPIIGFMDKKGVWCHSDTKGNWYKFENTVTHWMPLPEPPSPDKAK